MLKLEIPTGDVVAGSDANGDNDGAKVVTALVLFVPFIDDEIIGITSTPIGLLIELIVYWILLAAAVETKE